MSTMDDIFDKMDDIQDSLAKMRLTIDRMERGTRFFDVNDGLIECFQALEKHIIEGCKDFKGIIVEKDVSPEHTITTDIKCSCGDPSYTWVFCSDISFGKNKMFIEEESKRLLNLHNKVEVKIEKQINNPISELEI